MTDMSSWLDKDRIDGIKHKEAIRDTKISTEAILEQLKEEYRKDIENLKCSQNKQNEAIKNIEVSTRLFHDRQKETTKDTKASIESLGKHNKEHKNEIVKLKLSENKQDKRQFYTYIYMVLLLLTMALLYQKFHSKVRALSTTAENLSIEKTASDNKLAESNEALEISNKILIESNNALRTASNELMKLADSNTNLRSVIEKQRTTTNQLINSNKTLTNSNQTLGNSLNGLKLQPQNCFRESPCQIFTAIAHPACGVTSHVNDKYMIDAIKSVIKFNDRYKRASFTLNFIGGYQPKLEANCTDKSVSNISLALQRATNLKNEFYNGVLSKQGINKGFFKSRATVEVSTRDFNSYCDKDTLKNECSGQQRFSAVEWFVNE